MKYGNSPYILFAYSLRNTALSIWKTKRVLNMLPKKVLMQRNYKALNKLKEEKNSCDM